MRSLVVVRGVGAALAALMTLTVLIVLGPSAGLVASAAAEPPQSLPTQLNDLNGALGSGESRVRDALTELDTEDGIELYVAVVDSTDGTDIVEWADETAVSSGLGEQDALLVLATEDDDYVLNTAQNFELSEGEVQRVTDAMETPFSAGDYAGAVVVAADEMRTIAGSGSGQERSGDGSAGSSGSGTGSETGGSGAGWLLLGAVLLGLLVLVAVLSARRRRAGAGGPAQPGGPWAPPDAGAPALPLEELSRQANRMLVSTDEDVRGAERELAFAQAEFGDEAVAPFGQALARAKASVVEGFSLRQRLDDAEPETEQQQRQMLDRVVALCSSAREALTSQAQAFAQLRDLSGRVPQLVPALVGRVDAAAQVVAAATATVEDLSRRFSPTAVETVAEAPRAAAGRLDQARSLLALAGGSPTSGAAPSGAAPERQQAGTTPAQHPAVAVREAEELLSQAEELLASVDRVAAELQQAGRQLPRAIAGLSADVQAHRAGSSPSPALADALTRAGAALTYAESSGRVDPVGALTRLTEGDAALDRASASAREAGERGARAAAALPEAMSAAHARLAAVEGLVSMNRQLVGGTARTRLSESARMLAEASSLAGSDAAAALAAARRSLDLSLAAEQAAHADMSSSRWGPAPVGHVGTDVVMGGLVLDALFGGGWSGGSGWSTGGSSWGGGRRGGRGGGISWGGGGGGGGWSGGGRSSGSRRSSGMRRSSTRSSSRRSSRRR